MRGVKIRKSKERRVRSAERGRGEGARRRGAEKGARRRGRRRGAEEGARVILVVADGLQPLLSGLSGVTQCLPLSAGSLPAFDLHCPFSSLPLIFRTTLDSVPARPYLPQPAAERVQAWERRLGPRNKPRIGLAWSGSITHANDQRRSVPLKLLTRLLDADASFVSLQKDVRASDAALLKQTGQVVDVADSLTSFAETASLIATPAGSIP